MTILRAVLRFEATDDALEDLIRFGQAEPEAVEVREDFEEVCAFQVFDCRRKIAKLSQ